MRILRILKSLLYARSFPNNYAENDFVMIPYRFDQPADARTGRFPDLYYRFRGVKGDASEREDTKKRKLRKSAAPLGPFDPGSSLPPSCCASFPTAREKKDPTHCTPFPD